MLKPNNPVFRGIHVGLSFPLSLPQNTTGPFRYRLRQLCFSLRVGRPTLGGFIAPGAKNNDPWNDRRACPRVVRRWNEVKTCGGGEGER